jgi:catechol 2,3-dioxygenase-like lactoylglutathione lyase family enzyme
LCEAVDDRPAPGDIGIVVDDLAAAAAFFVALGLELEGEASVEGTSVDRINGLEGVRAEIVMLRTPDGDSKLELARYRSPPYAGDDAPAPANAPGIRHIVFAVDDIEASLAALLALLRARPGGDHRRAGGEDRLTGVHVRSGARRWSPHRAQLRRQAAVRKLC